MAFTWVNTNDLLVDRSAQLLELCVLVWVSFELFLDEAEELLDLLYKGLLYEDVRVLIRIILTGVAHVIPIRLTMTILQIIGNVSRD